MRIDISTEDKIEDIQKAFNALYPYLKIEFYKKKNGYTSLSKNEKILPGAMPLVRLQPTISNGFVEIYSSMTVKALEQEFYNRFQLSVQVYRRSGAISLETTITQDWTLYQQNEHGREITLSYIKVEKDNNGYNIRNDNI